MDNIRSHDWPTGLSGGACYCRFVIHKMLASTREPAPYNVGWSAPSLASNPDPSELKSPYTALLLPCELTWLQMRADTVRRNSGVKAYQSAVMPSLLHTARRPTT